MIKSHKQAIRVFGEDYYNKELIDKVNSLRGKDVYIQITEDKDINVAEINSDNFHMFDHSWVHPNAIVRPSEPTQYQYLMLDLETLDVTNKAVILQIGAAMFDVHGVKYSKCITVERKHQVKKYDRTWSKDTIEFWKQQPLEVVKEVFSGTMDLSEAIVEFDSFYSKYKRNDWYVKIIANSPQFDISILKTAYSDVNLDFPFRFNQELDFRTLKFFYDGIEKSNTHTAEQDAINQSNHITKFLREIKT